MIKEEWRDIEGFDGYQVSSWGRVASLKGRLGRAVLSLYNSRGYLRATLRKDGARHKLNVHVLVAKAWHGNRPAGMVTRHLDGNPLNNVPSNLRWGTYKENQQDSRLHGTLSVGSKNGKAKLTEEVVQYIRQSDKSNPELAKELGLYRGTVRRAKSGVTWGHLSA